VAAGGLTGGADQETLEDLRTRVLERFRTPPAGGNAAHMADVAEKSSPSVQKAFVYPCYNGPGTVAVVVVRAPTDTDKERDVDSIELTTVVEAAILAEFPEFVDILVQTVESELALRTSIGLALSDDNGWLDAEPFPVYSSQGYADVTVVTSTTAITINSDVPPTAGVSHIAWLSHTDWKVYHATVVSFTGTGPYACTLDVPLIGIAVGDLISPDATRMDDYYAAVLSQFAGLGPGQKTDLSGLLPRALRRPKVDQSWPSDLGPSVLKILASLGDEVLDASYLHRSITSPTVPNEAADQPNILVPQRIAFYPS
jgi:hypothetical protein